MEDTRSEVSATLSSFIPEFTDSQIGDLERTVFNSVITTFDNDQMDSVWNNAFETIYRRTAAELAANLTSEEAYSNGNDTLLKRVLDGRVQIEELTTLKPYEMRPETFEDLTTGEAELQKVIKRFTGVTSTMYECPKCQSNECTYNELQTRSADEGSTTFVTCLKCSYNWAFEG